MSMVCFFAACRNGNSSHSCDHVRSDHHCGDILAPLPTSVLKGVTVLGLYDIIRLARYDQVLSLLTLCRSQVMD